MQPGANRNRDQHAAGIHNRRHKQAALQQKLDRKHLLPRLLFASAALRYLWRSPVSAGSLLQQLQYLPCVLDGMIRSSRKALLIRRMLLFCCVGAICSLLSISAHLLRSWHYTAASDPFAVSGWSGQDRQQFCWAENWHQLHQPVDVACRRLP